MAAMQSCSFAAWMVGHVALAFISRSDREWIVRYGLFSNSVMNLWALAAVGFLLLALYVRPLREALRFAAGAPSDVLVSAALALLLVAPAELIKWRSIAASKTGRGGVDAPRIREAGESVAGVHAGARVAGVVQPAQASTGKAGSTPRGMEAGCESAGSERRG